MMDWWIDHIIYNANGGSPAIQVYRYFEKTILILTYWTETKEYHLDVEHFKIKNDGSLDMNHSRNLNYEHFKIPKKYNAIVAECLQTIEDSSHCFVMAELLGYSWAKIKGGQITSGQVGKSYGSN